MPGEAYLNLALLNNQAVLPQADTIAFDLASEESPNGTAVSPLTIHHFSSGIDRFGLVYVVGDYVTGADDISGVTWGGSACTLIVKAISGFPDTNGRFMYAYGIINPALGQQSVIISSSSNHQLFAQTLSYTGVAAEIPAVFTTNHTAAPTDATLTTSLTTPDPFCWTVLFELNEGGTASLAGAGSTLRLVNSTLQNLTMFDSGASIAAEGSYSMTTTKSPAPAQRGINHIMIALRPLDLTRPVPPDSLSATAISSNQIDLHWIDRSTGETGFVIERNAGPSFNGFVEIDTVGPNVQTYQDTGTGGGLTPNTTYRYRVAARSLGGQSAYTAIAEATTATVSAVPNPPDTLVATAVSSSRINLTWADHSNDEDRFLIERCTGAACSNFVQIATTNANVLAYSDPTVAPSTLYRYRVAASNSAGPSTYSNIEDETTPAPSGALTVGPGKTYANITLAVAAAVDGDRIEIDAGVYHDETFTITQNNLTLIGMGGLAHLEWGWGDYLLNQPDQYFLPNGKGIIIAQGDNSLFENLEFSGAAVSDNNGAGIRLEGTTCTVRSCYFHHCENGILGGTINPASTILIEFSRFERCGDCHTGQCSHNLYIGPVGRLIFRHNKSTNTKDGHNLKSRAQVSDVLYNFFSNKDANGSFNCDFPDGGTVHMVGNICEDGLQSDNVVLVAFANESQSNPTQKLYVVNNSFYSRGRTSGQTVYHIQANHGNPTLLIRNNVFAGGATIIIANGTPDTSYNAYASDASMYRDVDNGDFRLVAVAPAAIDQGLAVGVVDGYDLTAVYQYVDVASREARVVTGGVIDIGAFESSATAPTIPDDPTNLIATVVSSARIDLIWDDNSSNESDFRVERCSGSGCSGASFVEIATVAANVHTYSSTGLNASTLYRYRVIAHNQAGFSANYTNVDEGTTSAPGLESWTILPNSDLKTVILNTPYIAALYGNTPDGKSQPVENIINSWNSGIIFTRPNTEQWIIIKQGGHDGWFWNDVWGYRVDLRTGWVNLKQSYLPYITIGDWDSYIAEGADPYNPSQHAAAPGYTAFLDGSPPNGHTYDGCAYSPLTDECWWWLGFHNNLGVRDTPMHHFSMVSHTWSYGPERTAFPNNLRVNLGSDVRPASDGANAGHIIIDSGYGLFDYNPTTKTFTDLSGPTPEMPGPVTCRWLNGKLYIFGAYTPLDRRPELGISVHVHEPGVTPETILTTTGDLIPFTDAPGVDWEPDISQFVLWTGGNVVYFFDPVTLVKSSRYVSGPAPIAPPPYQGTYKRFSRIDSGQYLLMNSLNELHLLTLDLGTGPATGINFNGSSPGTGVNASSMSFNYSCSGVDRLGIVAILGDFVGGADDISSVRWGTSGGASNDGYCALVRKSVSGFPDSAGRFLYMYQIIAPPGGSQPIVVTAASGHSMYAVAASYTGVLQASQLHSSADQHSALGTSTTLTTGIDTSASPSTDNCWAILVEESILSSGAVPTAGAGAVRRVSSTGYGNLSIFDSNGPISPAGVHNMTTTRSPAPTERGINHIIAAFKPA